MTVLGRNLSEYDSVLVDAGLGRVPPPEQLMGKLQKPFQGSVDEHFRLLHTGSISSTTTSEQHTYSEQEGANDVPQRRSLTKRFRL